MSKKQSDTVEISVDKDELVSTLLTSISSSDEAFDLIKEIDLMQEDWGFTERCFRHFNKLHKINKEEEKKEIEEARANDPEGERVKRKDW